MDHRDKTAGDWQTMLSEQVRLCGRLLFRLAYGVLKDSDKSEDICQQVLLKAWQMRSEIRDPGALRGWLARVVINESLTLRRREQSEQKARLARPPRTVSDGSETGRAELRESLYTALAGLPQPTQAVVVLRLIQGMSGKQVADVLGLHPSDISRRLHAGMDHLRPSLEPVYSTDK